MLLEKLDDLAKAREDLAARVSRLADSDDITSRILKAASGMEQWVNVQPAMFEDILDEELSKFDKFRRQLEDDAQKQGELLEAVRVSRACAAWWLRNLRRLGLTDRHLYSLLLLVWFSPGVMQERHAQFIQSRKEDAVVKAREHALQSLDLAYHKYKEIVRNLEEGLKARSSPTRMNSV